jgi:3-oxo-5-alpha-steroid 4-dehydrogenase 1
VAAWSLAATAFSVFTLCFIGSRAVQHHQWYLKEFKDKYPKTRKALVPFVW